ncbi:hypothetical protein PDJ86_22345 [Bacillus cereus group sp. TH36-2LC]|uniref:hypothetical protein n=1 Tax=Bacillus cereus group sp. TH36-2LC TaxID=3018040 RepID=UPI0022DFEDB4|nr:hypothetical protein [Bacillus cereus group sp. TH36-2LC]MDA1509600.1 hypothetical protein [Bacillus cereus group sp. TH36-2LC]
MENVLKAIMEKLNTMDTKLDKMDNRLERLETKVDDVLLEARKFHGVASEEFDKIKNDTEVIKEQTENQTSSIEYLASITGIHEMKLNRKPKN